MPLPDCNTGLDTIPSVPSAWARLAGVQIRVAFGHACSPYGCCKGLALLGSQGLALHWPFCKPSHSMRGFLTLRALAAASTPSRLFPITQRGSPPSGAIQILGHAH